MTPVVGGSALVVAVSLVVGTMVISVVMAAIAVLVLLLWRRTAGTDSTMFAGSPGPRTDSHGVTPVAASGDAASAQLEMASAGTPPARPDGPPDRPGAARAPHPSGLGAAELAAIVEDGLASLRSDVDRLGEFVESVGSASAIPEELPMRPASQQVVLIDQMAAMIGADLDRACRLAETVAADVDRGHRARAQVHAELARIGLPVGFFAAMDTTAADLAVDLVRARLAVERLVRRFEALSSLYSSVRSALDLLGDLGDALDRATAIADPWRQAPQEVDLVPHRQVAQPLPG